MSPGRRTAGDAARERDQQPVADSVAEAVVDELEAVDVEEEDGAAERRVARRCGCSDAARRSMNSARFGQAGERVVQRVVDQPLLARSGDR